jgi:hypothetical protein
MNSRYVEWLQKRGVPLFEAGGVYWELYKGALIPASIAPCFVKLTHDEANALLQESRAWFLRYSSNPCEKETEWWYVICDSYDPKKLSSDARRNLRIGHRHCLVKRIEAEWLAEHGYTCYIAAYSRYRNATPVSKERFRKNILATIGGPFEYWGVFVEENFAGYCQCIVEENIVNTSIGKLDPAYLKHRSSYALDSYITHHYVVERGLVVTNGNRSVAHDTNFQDFILKLGYRRQYCRLNVIYQPWLKTAIQIIFPFRQLVDRLPDRSFVHRLQALLFQEELQRLCR